nr:MAG TPA: hypothetical protein [Caudoviricetes sp.]
MTKSLDLCGTMCYNKRKLEIEPIHPQGQPA